MRVVPQGGEPVNLGVTEANPTLSIIDYSRRVTDDFGVTTVVKRGFARRLSVRFQLPTDSVDNVQRRLAELRATTATWIVDDRFAWLSAEGFYKDFEVDLAVPPTSFCTLTVEGLAEIEVVADPGGDPAVAGSASTLTLLDTIDVTEDTLAASNVGEADQLPWAAGTTYAAGARVIAAHRIYESAVADNLGEDPAAGLGKWIDTGPTNRWAMFDHALGTATTGTSQIIVELTPETAITGLAVLDTDAGSIRVQAPGYDRTQLRGGDNAETTAVLFLDLVAAAGATVFVTIGAAGGPAIPRTWTDGAAWVDAETWQDASYAPGPGPVSIGTLLLGRAVPLGVTEAAPTAGIIDYSRKEVDEFGTATVVPRAWAKRMAAKALIRTDALDLVANRIAGVRARPSLWIAAAELDSLTVYGFYKDFSIEVGETVSKLSLSIEGLSTAADVAPLKALTDWPDVGDPTGTKPADNADVTGDNTAKDTAHVGGRPTQSVLDALDGAAAAAGDLGPLHDAIDAALVSANHYADQVGAQADLNLASAVQGLNGSIAAAQVSGDYAKLAIDNAGSDLNQRIAAALAAGNTAGGRVTTVENRLDTPGSGIVARLTTTEALINQPGVGLASRTSTIETSLGQATNRLSTVEATLTTPGSGLVSRTTVLEASSGALDTAVNGAGGVTSRLSTVESTLYAAGTGIAQRTSSLETSYGGISSRVSTIEQSLSGGNSNEALAQRTSTLEAQMGDRTSRIQTLETSYSDPTTGVVRRLTELTANVGSNTSRLTTAEAAIGDAAHGLVQKTNDLTVNYRQTGNIMPNSALTTLDGWIFGDNAGGGTMEQDRAGTAWMLGGVEHNLTLHQLLDKGDGLYSEAQSSPFAVTPGSVLQFYAYAMSRRANHWVSLYFYSSNGQIVGYGGEHIGVRFDEGGQNIAAWEITGAQAVTVPADAVFARMLLRQYGFTRQTDRYSWFSRPFVGEVPAGCSTWMPYAPGDNRTVAAATVASLRSTQSVLGDANGGVVKQTNDLLTSLGSVNGRLTTVEQVVGDASGGLVRRTSDLEISTSSLTARVGTVEQATTDGRFAAATRVGTLESQVNGAGGLAARLSSAEAAYTDGRFASSTSVTGLSASLGSVQATADAAYTAVTDGRFAGSSLVTGISATLGGVQATANSAYTAVTDGRFASATSLSTLNAQVNGGGGLSASVTQQAGAIADLYDRNRAWWSITADNGSGRAQLTVYAEGYGGGVDIVGDLHVSGNAVIDGTLTSGKFGPSSVAQTVFYTLTTSTSIPYG